MNPNKIGTNAAWAAGAAKTIGRVGALAVALGIGTAVATTPGVAAAEPSESDSSTSASSSSDSSSTAGVESSSAESSTPSGSAGSSSTESTSTDGSGPRVVVRSSGGADKSGNTDGDTSATDQESSTTPAQSEPTNEPAPQAASETAVVEPDEPEPAQSVQGEGEAPSPPESTLVAEPAMDDRNVESVQRAASQSALAPSPRAVGVPSTEASATLVSGVEAAGQDTDEASSAAPVVFSGGQPTLVAAQPVPAAVSAPETPVGVVPDVVSGLLAWVGLGPSATNNPVAPAPSPALVLASAFVRRELQQAVAAQSPTITSAAAQTTSQTDLGLIGAVLHLLFNNTPTIGYDPAGNTQDALGVVTGDLNTADAEGDALLYTVTQAPAHGSVVVHSDGSFTYTPEPAFALTGGTDSFNVIVSDDTYFHLLHLGGEHTVSATIDVTVEPINQPPVVGNPAFTIDDVDPDTGVVTGTVNVTDPNGDTLSYSLSADPATGAITVDATTGGFNYTPTQAARLNAGLGTGPDAATFTVTASDGQLSVDVTVTVPISAVELTVTATIPVDRPHAVVVNANGTRVYVTNDLLQAGPDTVSVINAATNIVTTTIPVDGQDATAVAVSPDGSRVYVINDNESTVSVINTATNTVVTTIHVGEPPDSVAVSPDGSRLYVTSTTANPTFDGILSVINTATNTVVTTIHVGNFPVGVAVSPNGSSVYVANSNSVSVIDTATNTVATTINIGFGLSDLAVSPDGGRLYVTGPFNTVNVIDTATSTVIATIDFGPSTLPHDVAVSPDGSLLYVTRITDDVNRIGGVSVVDTATNTVVATIPVGALGPGGQFSGDVAISPDGTHLYVTSFGDDVVAVIVIAP